MKSVKEMIEVMQAYERGEHIELRKLCDEKGWLDSFVPKWDWHRFDYRVKPKKKFVPFDTAEEFLAAQKNHGITLIDNNEKWYNSSVNCHCIVTLTDICTCFDHKGTFEYIFKRFHFEDGTPCGKEVQMSKISKEELEKIAVETAKRLFPYDTHSDKFTMDLRKSYIGGMLDCYKMIQKGIL